MDKTTIILLLIWVVLALAAFISAFFCPLIPKIIGIVFGTMNVFVASGIFLQIKYLNKK